MQTNINSGANTKTEKAIFAAGCFWHVEQEFRCVKGVTNVVSGYTGGKKANPTYNEVSTGTTGHAEAVEVSFNPAIVSYEELLKVFWDLHNPTQLNRQGPDIGRQYRSAIFFLNHEQEKLAGQSKSELEKSAKYNNKIVTEISPANNFYPAEEYHQRYFEKMGRKSCG